MTNQADVHLPEEAVEALAKSRWERRHRLEPALFPWEGIGPVLRRKKLAEAAEDLAVALPSLREPLKLAARIASYGRALSPEGPEFALVPASLLRKLATAFKDNTDSLGGEDAG